MLINEHPYLDEYKVEHKNLVRHYSDSGKKITQLQTGFEYNEAIDIYPCRFDYVESVNDIDQVDLGSMIDEPLESTESVTVK